MYYCVTPTRVIECRHVQTALAEARHAEQRAKSWHGEQAGADCWIARDDAASTAGIIVMGLAGAAPFSRSEKENP